MKVVIPYAPFNTMVKSMRKIIRPRDFRRVAQRAHFQLFPTALGSYCFRAMLTDGYVLCEDVIDVVEVLRDDGCRVGSFDLPRLAAKSDVTLDVTEDATVISFDEVTFTYRAMRISKDEREPSDSIIAMVKTMQTGSLQQSGRLSVCLNPKFLAAALDACAGCKTIRLDVGSPMEPVFVTGTPIDDKVFRAIMPTRSAVSDQTYRDGITRRTWPTSADLKDPGAEEQEEENE